MSPNPSDTQHHTNRSLLKAPFHFSYIYRNRIWKRFSIYYPPEGCRMDCHIGCKLFDINPIGYKNNTSPSYVSIPALRRSSLKQTECSVLIFILSSYCWIPSNISGRSKSLLLHVCLVCTFLLCRGRLGNPSFFGLRVSISILYNKREKGFFSFCAEWNYCKIVHSF